jgi:hypothetical protein
MFLYCGANVYGPDELKERLSRPTEWSERFHRKFEHVLEMRALTAKDYELRTDIDFDSDDELFIYLRKLYDFLFAAGPYPEFSA